MGHLVVQVNPGTVLTLQEPATIAAHQRRDTVDDDRLVFAGASLLVATQGERDRDAETTITNVVEGILMPTADNIVRPEFLLKDCVIGGGSVALSRCCLGMKVVRQWIAYFQAHLRVDSFVLNALLYSLPLLGRKTSWLCVFRPPSSCSLLAGAPRFFSEILPGPDLCFLLGKLFMDYYYPSLLFVYYVPIVDFLR